MSNPKPNRRNFLQTSTGAALALAGLSNTAFASDTATADPSGRGRVYKSVKWGMIQDGGSVLEKFQRQKELGYDGMELISPMSPSLIAELKEASHSTGMPIHGVVNMVHWNQRLSDPDESVRAIGRQALEQSLHDAHDLGGSSSLLVVGKVTGEDETHDDVWNRSIPEIRKVLPLASRLGIRVLVENVWNGFCETPEQLRDYIDEIDSPWVGVYFDIGNAQKFSPPANWIRVLGSRIVKLDVKGWGKAGGFGKIGDGDVDWPEVRLALQEIGFTGWCTAEVAGGDQERLADVATRVDKALKL